MSEPKPRLRVAICGGGIGGLAFAAILAKCSNSNTNIRVDIYEAAPQFAEIGAGISMYKRTWKIIKFLGYEEALARVAITPPVDETRNGFQFRKGDQKEGYSFYQMRVPYGAITFHRADVLKVLTDLISPSHHLHFSKRLVSYSHPSSSSDSNSNLDSHSGPVRLHFEDGSVADADVLIGADGIKSATRGCMYTHLSSFSSSKQERDRLLTFVNSEWTGSAAYRTLIDKEVLLRRYPGHRAATVPMNYFGKDKHVVSYPISQGRQINLIFFVTTPGGEGSETGHEVPTVEEAKKEDVERMFVGWEGEVRALLDCVQTLSKWCINVIRGLPTYVHANVALLGDAAHAMTTHFGAGAGQAIEDGYILARLLSNPLVSKQEIPTVLGIYDSLRRPFSQDVVERSRKVGFMYEFNHEESRLRSEESEKDVAGEKERREENDGREEKKVKVRNGTYYTNEYLHALGRKAGEEWAWQWESDVDETWREAERLLGECFEREEVVVNKTGKARL